MNQDTLVRIDKLALLFQQSYPAIFVSLITAALLTAILWPAQEHSILLTWFAIIAFTALGRYVLFMRYRQASPQGEDILAWEKPYFVTLTLTTLTWGIGSAAIMPGDSPVHQVLIIAFMLGMSGGAISLYSAHRLMTLITVSIVLLPVTAWFLVLNSNPLSVGMAVGVAIFFVSAIRATKALALAQHQSFSLTHALTDSEEKHRLAMEAAQDGLWDWDVITGNVYYSPSWCHIIGEDNIQNSYTTWEDRIHPEDKTRILDSIKAHMAGETPTWKEEHRLRSAEGAWIWVLGRGKVVETDQDDSPLRMIGTMTDISRRKQAEAALHESMEKYQGLVEDIGDKLVVFSHEPCSGELLYVSSGFDSIFGFSREKALNQSWQDIISWLPDSTDRANNCILQLTEGEIDFTQFDMEFTHPDGKERSIRVSCHPIKNELGRVATINGVVEDITEQMSAQKRLRLAGNVLTKTQDGIVITDSHGLIVDANPASLQASGYTLGEVLGSNPSIFSSGKHTPEFYAQMWSTLNTSGHWEGEIWNRRKSGEIYTEQLSIDAVKDEAGKLQNYIAIFHDISYFKEREDELRQIAFHDVLTGLPNRLVLNDRMQQALLQSGRNKDRIAVCFLDLDGFKPINDTHGHDTGDHVLVEVARRLKDTLRSNDTVARIGGDEFVLLLQDIKDTDELDELMQRVLKVISRPYNMPNATVTVSASIGVAIQKGDYSDAEILLSNADQAMYNAKKHGKNCYRIYKTNVE
ncbi:MAG: diguanylate cyclase [Gammaproteobacteria bacterium]|nr:diguanylate cyclase [Gammaproteobacteria bacterium]